MQAVLARQVAVVIEHGVKRHVRVADVMGQPGREEDDVVLAELAAARVVAKRALEVDAGNSTAHGLIGDALAYWREEPGGLHLTRDERRLREIQV